MKGDWMATLTNPDRNYFQLATHRSFPENRARRETEREKGKALREMRGAFFIVE
jgi:hypothetical protein